MPRLRFSGVLAACFLAVGGCEKSLETNTNDTSAQLDHIRILFGLRRFKEAEQRCEEVLKINDKLHEPKLIIAQIRRANGDNGGALKILSEILAQKPTQVEALLRRAETYLDLQKCEEALADANEALRLTNNKNPYANYVRGCIYMQTHKLDQAIAELRIAAAGMPKHLPTHFWLARCLLMKDRLREAIEELNVVVKLDPRFTTAWLVLVSAHLQNGDPDAAFATLDADQAIKHCLKALEVDPKNVDVHFLLGLVYLRKESFDEAKAQFEEVLKLRGRHPAARLRLAEIHTLRREFGLAQRQLEACTADDPKLPAPRYELARLYALQGQYGKAQAELEKLLALDPDKAKIQRALDDLRRQKAEPSAR